MSGADASDAPPAKQPRLSGPPGGGIGPDGRPGPCGNVLLITADQWRAAALGCAGHPLLRTPTLDALAAEGVRFARHFTQATPCSPARTCIHTGRYSMNTRVTQNGVPLEARHTNWCLEARKLGYDPILVGYTDTVRDFRTLPQRDPLLQTDEGGLLPGITPYMPFDLMHEKPAAWAAFLRRQGYEVPSSTFEEYPEPIPANFKEDPAARAAGYAQPAFYKAEHSDTAFYVDKCIEYLEAVDGRKPWALHLSLLKPHPPWLAPEPYNRMYHPDELDGFCRAATMEDEARAHPWLQRLLQKAWSGKEVRGRAAAASAEAEQRSAKAVYYGLISEVDAQLGRLFAWLRSTGAMDRTLIIFTSDHGEQLFDHWLTGKMGFFDQSYHVPCIVRDPRPGAAQGSVVEHFTEHVDLMPTLLAWLGAQAPAQCDGHSLLPFLALAGPPPEWRTEVHWEYDFRAEFRDELGCCAQQCSLMVARSGRWKYVHFANLPPLLFDLTRDPQELENLATKPEFRDVLLDCAMRLLSFRMTHVDRALTGRRLERDGKTGVVEVLREQQDLPFAAGGLPRYSDAYPQQQQ